MLYQWAVFYPSPHCSPPALSLPLSVSLSHSHTHTLTDTHNALSFPSSQCKRCERQIYALLHCGHNTEVTNGMLMNVLPRTSISGHTCAHTESHSRTRICRASTNIAKTITMHYFKYAFLCKRVGVFFCLFLFQTTAACFDLNVVLQESERELKE